MDKFLSPSPHTKPQLTEASISSQGTRQRPVTSFEANLSIRSLTRFGEQALFKNVAYVNLVASPNSRLNETKNIWISIEISPGLESVTFCSKGGRENYSEVINSTSRKMRIANVCIYIYIYDGMLITQFRNTVKLTVRIRFIRMNNIH